MDSLVVLILSLSCIQLIATPWTVACQDPLSMGFSRQEYWSGLLFPSPGDLPDPGMEPGSLNWHKRAVAFQVTKTEQAVKICWATRLCFRQAGT